MDTDIAFPFVPKSTRHLRPGHFWAIPLADGTFGCGRVLELMPAGMPGARVGFLGALMSWRGRHAPTADAIAGAGALEQGIMHVLAIKTTGGAVLGMRALELDSLAPWEFVNGNVVQRGFTVLRAWQRSDSARLPALSWWAYDVIQILADKRLLSAGESC